MSKKNQIIKRFKEAMQGFYGKRLDKIILYGSYAREDYNENSDIDFLVVLKDEKVNPYKEIVKVSNILHLLDLELDAFISFVPTSINDFKTLKNMLFHNIKKEGVQI